MNAATTRKEWRTVTIRQLNHFLTSGSRGWAEFYADSGAAFFRIGNLNRNTIKLDVRDVKCVKLPVESSEGVRTRVQPRDILISITAELGLIGFIPPDHKDEGYVNQHIALLRISDPIVENSFVAYFLAGPSAQARFREITDSGAKAGLNLEAIRRFPVDLPSLAEQGKIADILTTWDLVLEKLDALIEAKERRKKALMQQLLSGRKQFPSFGKISWQKARMNTLLKRVFRPIKWAADKPLSLVSIRRRSGGLFRRAGVLGADYKTQDLHELKSDDFLISKRQVVHGAWALVTPKFEGSHVSKEYAIMVNTAPDKLHMPFFGWLAQTPRMIRLARVASTGVHIEKLIFDSEVFLRDIISIPSDIKEQQAIAAILDTCDEELRLLRAQRTAFDKQKRGLMQRLLTGKIRVKIN